MKILQDGKFRLTDKEVAVVQACLFYCNTGEGIGLTKEAGKILDKMMEKLNMDHRIFSLSVWE